MKRAWVRLSAGVLVSAALAFLAAACGSASSPSSPTTPAVKPKAAVIISSTSVKGEQTSTGYKYTVVVHLKETGGVGATINAVDLRWSSGAGAIGSTHFDSPLLTIHANKIGASGTADSKDLISTDDNAGHPYATKVEITCSFVDDNQNAGTCTGTADVPPLPPATYTVSGTVREAGGSGLSGASVSVISGTNAGQSTTADSLGAYTLGGLSLGSCTLRASKSGYDSADQSITLSADTTVNFSLTRTSGGCGPTSASCGAATAKCNDGTYSCSQTRSGTCSSHGGVACWICPGTLCDGIRAK
jgi:hypothetical protein